ncbi:MAG: helix-turn-helix transcriptional regulator [Oscillospiraceae bacterium]|nr:helix-turn-helix transcriptional regulator [Oscillospiraceae bacterium]
MMFLSEKLNNPQVPGKILFREDENTHLPAHWHNSVEICFFLRGGFRAHIDNQSFTVRDNELFLVNSGQMHYLGELSVGEDKGITLVADMDFWENICPDLNLLEFELSICPEKIPELKQLMMHLYDSSRTYYQEKVSNLEGTFVSYEVMQLHGLICMIYYTLMKYFSRPRTVPPFNRLALQETYLQEIIHYINEHYTEQLTLKDIAQLHNISCEHLSRIFKKKLGLTFKEYLYSIRLTHACRLLLHTNKSTLEISLEAGFPDLRSFGRQFDRAYHMTPKEYRRRFQKK